MTRLFVEEDDKTYLGRGNFRRDVDAYLACLLNMLPASAAAVDAEILGLDARGDLRRRDRDMRQRHAWDGALNQLDDEAGRADLGELGSTRDEVRFADGRLDLEDPARRPDAALVGDIALVEEALDLTQRNADRFGGHDDFEMPANVIVKRSETHAEGTMVIDGQGTRMYLEAEGAERAAEARSISRKSLSSCGWM